MLRIIHKIYNMVYISPNFVEYYRKKVDKKINNKNDAKKVNNNQN